MNTPGTVTPADYKSALQTLVNSAFRRAKQWLALLFLLQAFLFAGGVIAIFYPTLTLSYPYIAFPLACAHAWIANRISKNKSVAEDCKRKLEIFDGFGRRPSSKWLANVRLAYPAKEDSAFNALLTQGITYDSDVPVSPRRVLENLAESAWFSYHLAGWCRTAITLLTFAAGVLILAIIFYFIGTLNDIESLRAASKAVAATFVFLLSLGAVRGMLAYSSFASKADKIDDEADELAKREGDISENDALRLLHDYQMARASAPMIPTWVWRIRRDALNKNWKIKKGEI